jgi:biofilm PGA synthesis N-glycosyltransferase PgaC
MINCSIGIMAYNEEANIGRLLDVLLRQNLSHCSIKEIFVVASGCTDRTEDIVKDYIRVDDRIKLLVQKQREGKASAINLFLSKANADVLIVESGDTIPEADTIEKLVIPFSDPTVGMTGGHPVPVNPQNTCIGFIVNLMWRLHHRIALEHPKLGELIAFRNIVREIPFDTAVDEASIEAIVIRDGYKLKYVEDALVHNKGPENIRDFLKQRRRIAAGHLYVKHKQAHMVSTTSGTHILGPFVRELKGGVKEYLWGVCAMLLEIIGRTLGYYDYYVKKRNPFIWDIAQSTKKLKGD